MESLFDTRASVLPDEGVLPASGECHLWPIPVRGRPEWYALLTVAEQGQAERFRVAGAREVFVTSRAAQRLIGARYLGVRAQDVRIERTCAHCGGPHGRPRFQGWSGDYSLTHTNEWVVLAAVGSGLVGVDLENLRTTRSVDDLAGAGRTSGVPTPGEQTQMASVVDGEERVAAFLRLWTRKESVVKLTGHGLLAPLTQIDVSGARAVVQDMPAGWPQTAIHLTNIAPGRGHIGALATDRILESIVRCGPFGDG